MTLALYGKTKRRQVGLLLGGLLAVMVAVIGGLFALNSDDAKACECEPVNIQIHKYLPKDNLETPWDNQGSGQGNWKFTIYADDAGKPGSVLVADVDHLNPSADFPPQTVWIKETDTDGDTFYGWFVPDASDNSGNAKCNQAPADFTTGVPDSRYSTKEYLEIDASFFETTGNDTGLFHICAYNAPPPPPTRTIEVCKVVVDNNDGTIDGGRFAFAYDWKVLPTGQLFIAADIAGPHATEGSGPVCETFEAPADKAVRIIEVNQRPGGSPQLPGSWNGDDPLYPQNSYDGLGTKDNSVELPVGVNTVTFYNKTLPRTREILITKDFVNLGGYAPTAADLPAFTLNPSTGTSCAAPVQQDADTWTVTCTVPYDWAGAVIETPKPGWRQTACVAEAGLVSAAVVAPSEFNFCNEPVGTIRIEKFDTVNGTTGPAWEFTVSGGSYTGANPTADQDAPFEATVLLSNTPITVAEVLARTQEQCTETNTYYTIATPPADNVINTPGEVQTWTFQNSPCGILGTGGIVIEKYLDRNGDGDADDPGDEAIDGWSFTTTGGGILPADQVRQTSGGGQILDYVSGFDAGTLLTVTEGSVAGFTLTGVTLDGVDLGTNVTNGVVVIGGQTRVIRYYNQPLGSITVEKQTFRLGTAEGRDFNDDDGWRITVTSAACGVAVSGLTGTDGTVTFTGLPLCDDYVVAEDLTAPGAPGYAPFTPATVNGVTPGLTAATRVTFVNTLFEFVPFIPTPVPPTPTVVPPTETPVPPTATPTEPKPTSTVLGERTPGPIAPTPIVPSAGDGADGTGAGFNLALVAAGLATLAAGFGATVLYGKRRQ